MKLRSLPVTVAAAAAVLISVSGLTPAYADITAPGVTLDAPTNGHITGTVTSDQPYVAVRLAGDVPATFVTMVDGSGTFDLETWGYGADPSTGKATLQAAACDGTGPDPLPTCSALQTDGVEFTPIDNPPDVTWFTDSTLGPDDPNPSLTVSDPSGGGELEAVWSGGDCGNTGTDLDLNGTTQLNICTDGDGVILLHRCATANHFNCTSWTPDLSKGLHVHRALAIDSVFPGADTITQAHPSTSFKIDTDRTGTYALTWHLEKDVEDVLTDVPGSGGTATGTLDASGATESIPVPGSGLDDGRYVVSGTITVQTPSQPAEEDYGTYSDVPVEGSASVLVDRTGPSITSIAAAPAKIYPLISGSSTYRSTTTLTVSGADAADVSVVWIYQQATGALVRTRALNGGTATWDGRRSDGTAVPSGTYQLKVKDADGNFSATLGTVSVSGYKLVTKTWTHTYTPGSTFASSYVGKCSTLRQPSLRGWYHSFGYYANTRCSSQSSKDSLISTVHAIILPKALQYVDIRVSAYGGAAKARPRSKAIVRYLTTSKDPDKQWSSDKVMSATMGTHSGYTRSTKGLVFSDHSFGWGVYTGFGYQYDVKSFTVVLHYKVLG